MYKIAILSDIHGNITALEAVLEGAQQERVTDYWVLGDLIMPGAGSSDLLNRLRSLPNVIFVGGNWDNFFLSTPTSDLTNPTNLYGARLAQYHHEQLSDEELNFIKELPSVLVKDVADFEFLICHHLPHKRHGGDLWPAGEQEVFDSLFAEYQSDVAVYGHVHHQLIRYSSEGQLIINPGAVYQSFFHWEKHRTKVNRAQYTILEIDENGIGNINFKKVDYDVEKEIALAKERGLPYLELYEDALKTGRSYTHDLEVLGRMNIKYGYEEDVKNFFGV